MLSGEKLALRWERTPDRLPPEVDRLVVWSPQQLDDDTWTQLREWVSAGHTLILGGSGGDFLAGSIGEATASDSTAHSAAAGPVTAEVGTVAVGGGVFSAHDDAALVHLVDAEGTPVLVSWPYDGGRIYWSADEVWLSNGLIDKADNLTLALNLLAPPAGKKVAFDELSHGYAAADRWWQLLRGSLQWFVVELAIFLIILFWAAGARFGAPLAVPQAPPRAAVEYVFSMSQLYRRARARSVALEALHRSLTRDLGQLLGGLQGMDHAEVARRTAERTGLKPEDVKALLDRTAPGSQPQPTDKELIELARRAGAIQRRVHNAGYRDRNDA